jgi:hypothetical protein
MPYQCKSEESLLTFWTSLKLKSSISHQFYENEVKEGIE